MQNSNAANSNATNSSATASLEAFVKLINESLIQNRWDKLLLTKYRGKEQDLQRLVVRPIELRNETALSFVSSYKDRDITKNFSLADGIKQIETLLGTEFKSAHLLTVIEETQLDISKKGKVAMHTRKLRQTATIFSEHNREKKRFVDISRPYLTALGITDLQQRLIPSMARKWKQVNKFIEVLSHALEQTSVVNEQAIQVVDFGSGKGYLTFALHDYLRHTLHNASVVTGVELRPALAELCNQTASKLEYQGLSFVCGDVKTHAPKNTDVMIALHACDTATDYAIHYGIRTQASIIMCSPCCHKEIRPQLRSPDVLEPMLQYGVHLGQQAEMVTDSLRALLLEANGYTTKVFEFVSLEHTNKNKMILAVKKNSASSNKKVLEKIASLKDFYGIKEQCLEQLLAASE
jgi:hypothetical protein